MASGAPVFLSRRVLNPNRLAPTSLAASSQILRTLHSLHSTEGLQSRLLAFKDRSESSTSSPRSPLSLKQAESRVTPLRLGPSAIVLKKSLTTSSSSTSENQREERDNSESETQGKASFRERLRHLWKRYGWWAIGVYNLWSLADFSLTWAAIHWFGADHIRQLETRIRTYVGLGKRKTPEEKFAAWPLSSAADVGVAIIGEGSQQRLHETNQEAAKKAVKRLMQGFDERKAHGESQGGSSLWAEAVLAYTIHKTLLLPFRVMGTGAITPSFVNWMVRLGWAKPLPPLKKASATAAATVSSTSEKGAARSVAAVTGATSKRL